MIEKVIWASGRLLLDFSKSRSNTNMDLSFGTVVSQFLTHSMGMSISNLEDQCQNINEDVDIHLKGSVLEYQVSDIHMEIRIFRS